MADLVTDNAAARQALEGGNNYGGASSTYERFWADAYAPQSTVRTVGQEFKENERAMYAVQQVFSEANATGFHHTDGYDNRGFLTHVSNAIFNTGTTDGALTRESIQEMLRESDNLLAGTGLYNGIYNPKFIKQLQWLDDHWDEPVVQRMLTPDGDLTKESAAMGSQWLKGRNDYLVGKYNAGDPSYLQTPDQILGNVAITGKVSDALEKATTVVRKEGTWQSAERILKMDGQPFSTQDVTRLSDALSAQFVDERGRLGQNTSLRSLPPDWKLVTGDNLYLILQRIKDQELQQRLKKVFETP